MAHYIRHKPTGIVYPIGTHPDWVERPDFEVVGDHLGNPLVEDFQVEEKLVTPRGKRKAGLTNPNDAALSADASRGL